MFCSARNSNVLYSTRKNTFEDMQAVIHAEQLAGGERAQTEFEAFVLNEMCQFSGAFCNSLHCDEMGYLCRVPYHLEKIAKKVDCVCTPVVTVAATLMR